MFTDHLVPYANVGAECTNLIIGPAQEEGGEPELFTLGKGRSINLYSQAQKTLIGTIGASSDLELANKEEFGWGRRWWGRRPIFIGGTHFHSCSS